MANLLRNGSRTESVIQTVSAHTPTTMSIKQSSPKKIRKYLPSPAHKAQMWLESIKKENTTRKQWQGLYGWMGDYDSHGNLIEKTAREENHCEPTESVPKSRGHDYGFRLSNEVGREISSMQQRFHDQHRKQISEQGLGYRG